jgi:hypothetical protein
LPAGSCAGGYAGIQALQRIKVPRGSGSLPYSYEARS